MSHAIDPQASDRNPARLKTGRRRAAPTVPKTGAKDNARKPDPVPVSAEMLQAPLVCGVLVLAAGLWAYWPTLVTIVTMWNQVADYSHGFLVVPVAVYFLWARRASCPGLGAPDYAVGFGLLAVMMLVRYVGARYYLGALDG